jgi:5-methylcytosine-specific restriction endonuclease McrA
MSNYVFVIDQNKRPLTPCKPSKARKLLEAKKAAVFRRYPFTIILLKEVINPNPEPIEIKIDPGSKVTGLALKQGNKIIWGAELHHRGQAIKADLDSRRATRRSRRNRKTRYRKARFLNRKKPSGWLAPSLKHRVETTLTWVNRIRRLAPIGSISQELVRFDLQKIDNPEISGVEYQQGELFGYEVREYLLNKWERKCTYCSKQDTPLQVEHIKPRAKGGTDRVSNLCLACESCNQKKGTQDINDFLKGNPNLLARIKSQAKAPLKDAAAVNSTRWVLFNQLKDTGLPVNVGSGGRTKYNRVRLGFPKTHWIDAACVGVVEELELETIQPITIIAKGWGSRQMVQIDKYGFPRRGYTAKQKVEGWSTGDIVNVIGGKHIGLIGQRLKTVRAKGSFDIRISTKEVVGIKRDHLKLVHRKDGYEYKFK